MEKLLVDYEGLAEALSLSPRTLLRLGSKGMPCIRVGRRVLFDPVAVKEWLVRGGANSETAAAVPPSRPGRPRRVVP